MASNRVGKFSNLESHPDCTACGYLQRGLEDLSGDVVEVKKHSGVPWKVFMPAILGLIAAIASLLLVQLNFQREIMTSIARVDIHVAVICSKLGIPPISYHGRDILTIDRVRIDKVKSN